MHVLAISGSVRLGASNTSLLEAAARVAPEGIVVRRYPSIAVLPHFNPDDDTLDQNTLPTIVADFRALIGEADALLLSTPEYAHGLPGSFKNALDWLVGSLEFPGKPVAMISPSVRSTYAQAQLREILKTMSAHIVEPASVVIPLPRREMSVDEIVADEALAGSLRSMLGHLEAAVRYCDHQVPGGVGSSTQESRAAD
jgi:NAD(P)H-dependent FMN reductase